MNSEHEMASQKVEFSQVLNKVKAEKIYNDQQVDKRVVGNFIVQYFD